MNRVLATAIVMIAVIGLYQPAAVNSNATEPTDIESDSADKIKQEGAAKERMESKPLAFTENQGQWDERVKFRANAGGATIWFTTDGIYYQFTRRIFADQNQWHPRNLPRGRPLSTSAPSDSIEQLVIKATFVGANPDMEIVGEGLMEYKCNYFIGNDPGKWRTHVRNYSSLLLREVYPGIDLRFFGAADGQAAYHFVATPAADTELVKIEYQGFKKNSVDVTGRIATRSDWGDMTTAVEFVKDETTLVFDGPLIRSRQTVDSDPAANGNRHSESLWLNLGYSTYLGGSMGDFAMDIEVDSSGAAYVVGITSSADFPTLNPYQADQGGSDVFVTKLSASGNSLIYSTYLGGSGSDVYPLLAVDGSGDVYVIGTTYSEDFPILNPYQTNQGTTDVFVTKLSGSGSLIYSTYLGGGHVDSGGEPMIDGSGAVYVTGLTQSWDFPTLIPYQAYQGGIDRFVTKLSGSGSSLVYSTFLGGSQDDMGGGIALDGSGAVYLVGSTNSPDFPTVNPYQGALVGGVDDAFVTKLVEATSFVPGDADGSGITDIDDVVHIIAYIFSGGLEPRPYESGDADCSGAVDIDDVVYLIAYIFSGGPEPGDPNGDGIPEC